MRNVTRTLRVSVATLTATLAVAAALTGCSSDQQSSDKAKLVVDGDKRLANIETMNQGLAHYQVGFTVGEVETQGDEADAKVTVNSPHGTMPDVPMAFRYVDGAWKLSDAGACTILGMARAGCQ